VSVEEARELIERLRRTDPHSIPGDATAVAVGFERAIDESRGEPSMTLNAKETAALYWVLEAWLVAEGADALGERLLDLRSALYSELNSEG
jgi:hypothetical protein